MNTGFADVVLSFESFGNENKSVVGQKNTEDGGMVSIQEEENCFEEIELKKSIHFHIVHQTDYISISSKQPDGRFFSSIANILQSRSQKMPNTAVPLLQ